MFYQTITNHLNYDSDESVSTYDSENTENSLNSLNSSNYTITTDPINYYRKDVLKQNHIKNISKRKQQRQDYLELHRNIINNKNDYNYNYNYNGICGSNIIIHNQIGYNTKYDKNTPLIDYLINKRINYCELGASSHIAAFFPNTTNLRHCFIRGWKGKDRYG